MKRFRTAAIVTLSLLFATADIDLDSPHIGFDLRLAPEAEARVGRPMTPVSVAGVARRTTRRTIRRGAFIAAIPAGCALGNYYGYSLYYCGGNYYQKSGHGYVVVYF